MKYHNVTLSLDSVFSRKTAAYGILCIDFIFFVFSLPFFLLFIFHLLTIFWGSNAGLIQMVINDYEYFHEVAKNITFVLDFNLIFFALGIKFFLEVIDFILIGYIDRAKPSEELVKEYVGENRYHNIIMWSGFIGLFFFFFILLGQAGNNTFLGADISALQKIL